MQILYSLLFVECFITLATFALGMYMVYKVNKNVNLKLENITPNIPKVKLFTMSDIISIIFISLIPIFNFIYISVACFNLHTVVSQSTNEIVSKILENYLNECKEKKENIEKLVNRLKNKE